MNVLRPGIDLCASIAAVLLAVAASACSSQAPEEEQTDDALAAGGCGPAAGTLTIMAIPPSTNLDWSTPNRLIQSSLRASRSEDELVRSGQAKVGHFIGHTHVQMDCGELSIPLTGQTGGGGEWQSLADGFGALFRDFPGTLNEFPGDKHDATVEDVRLRTASGNITRMSFKINRATCQRLRSYYDEYKRRRAYEHFTPVSRPRRFEGGGCATFGASFLDVGGLMNRADITPLWTRSVLIGNRRFADFLGSGTYPYGSDLLARLPNGQVVSWPKGVKIPARTFSVVVPETSVLDAWTGPEDQPFEIAGVTLPESIQSAVPITLYDPQLIANWISETWKIARGLPNANRLGLSWNANVVGKAREIVADATCKRPPTTPFDGDDDDFFANAE